MRRMKYKIGAFCLLAIGLWGCLEDKGVYDYDFDVAPEIKIDTVCLLYTSPSPRDVEESRMPSSA